MHTTCTSCQSEQETWGQFIIKDSGLKPITTPTSSPYPCPSERRQSGTWVYKRTRFIVQHRTQVSQGGAATEVLV